MGTTRINKMFLSMAFERTGEPNLLEAPEVS